MELHRQTKGNGLTFKWKDVTFHVREKATAGDQHDLVTLVQSNKDGKAEIPRNRWYRKAIELFVESWEGVTENGSTVPFSLSALESFPANKEEDVILLLGSFIHNNCFKELDESKKKG